MNNIFTYGSLMYPEIFAAVAGQTYRFQPATLSNWRRHRLQGETYPAAIPCSDHQLEGVVWFNVSADSLERLDRFETSSYARQQVQVHTHDRGTYAAYIYRWLDRSRLLDEDWSTEVFETQHLKHFFEIHDKVSRSE
jgi:gamma-glutamylcyclotransferase (GGCT)/AIG2-like uncharacterized protein YtfP